MISMTSHNDTRIVSNFSKVGGPEEYIETQNGVYRVEMKNITDEAIQQIEDLAISTACGSESIDIQKTITRIGVLIFDRLYALQLLGLSLPFSYSISYKIIFHFS